MTNPKKSSKSSESLSSPVSRKGHGRVTLREVALLAEVAPMTVSRFLRSPEMVSAETGQKIQLALEKTGYTPNLQAGHLASGRSNVVAVIVPNMSHSIFADTLHGLGAGLQQFGLQMLVASSDYSLEQEERQIRAVLGWAPAGLILTGRHHSPASIRMLAQAVDKGMPVIEMWDRSQNAHEVSERVRQVGFDHMQAGQMMADGLHERSYARWVFIDSGVAQDFRAHERAQGFLRRAQQLKQPCQCIRAAEGDAVAAGRQAMLRWLSSQTSFSTDDLSIGLACANDMLAVGAWLATQQAGLHVPEQVGILGFGDFPLGRYWAGGLSTVRIDGERIGRQCAELLGSMVRTERGEIMSHGFKAKSFQKIDDSASYSGAVSPELIWRAT